MKFLIIKTSSLGDIIHAFPALEYLKNKYPNATIDWVVEEPFAGLVQAHPLVSNVFCVATKQWRRSLFAKKTWQGIRQFISHLRQTKYDAAFDLQGNGKSGIILTSVCADRKVGFDRASVHEWPNLLFTNTKISIPTGKNIREDCLNIVAGYLGKEGEVSKASSVLSVAPEQKTIVNDILAHPKLVGSKIMVCPGSAWKNKQMEPQALVRFLTLIQEKFGASFLFLWGSSEEKAAAEKYQSHFENSIVVPRLQLATLQNLMEGCDLVISVDSLALHLAGTTKTPTYSVFGPSLAAKYNPVGPTHGMLQGTCPYGRTFVKRCPILRTCPTGACIRSITGDQIFSHFDLWWLSALKAPGLSKIGIQKTPSF